VLLVLVVLIGAAFLIGERVFRDYAEQQIEQQVGASLPDGVGGRVTADIHGFSALQQWASGSFDDVTLRSKGLTVAGAPASARIEVRGLPVDGSGTIPDATGTLTVGQAAFKNLPPLKQVNASNPVLKKGTVSTAIKQTFLGLAVTIDVTLTPSLRGQYIRLTPTDASLKSGPLSVPALAIVRQLVPNGVSVCTAAYLPPAVRVTAVGITPGRANVRLVAKDLDLDDLRSGRTGSCS
jgi:hypothetical protein